MHYIIDFIVENSSYAPWICFGLILLAGINLPISIDLVLAVAAFLSATMLPKLTPYLFISVLFGTYFSAWICYWLGRKAGKQLLKISYFSKLLPQNRLDKVKRFYQKYGLLTLMIGRFIPFGFRNCLFMTTGMAKCSFLTFLWRDALACIFWTSCCFSLFYQLAHSYELLVQKIKLFNSIVFITFGMIFIVFLGYKKYRKRHAEVG